LIDDEVVGVPAALALRARRRVIELAGRQTVHLGASLSVIDILAVLYGSVMRFDPGAPGWADRDRLVLSKGHAAYGLYAILAEVGLLDGDLATLPAHPGEGVAGVDAATGALGHGLALGCGMALGARLSGRSHHVTVVTGDGELDEGTTWEAAQLAGHRRLGRLTAIVDRNGLQQEGATESVLALEPLADKWRAFGWEVTEADGHDHDAVRRAILALRDDDRPGVVLASTVKGRGVSFLEGDPAWHSGTLDTGQLARALAELEAQER
jgi:transketolase